MEDFAKYFRRQAASAHATKRGQFLNYWRSLTHVPMLMEPVAKDHVGSSKAEDGVRITGSPRFIAAVIARLKDILLDENPRTKIDVEYKQTRLPKANGELSYILYVKLRER